ncbi:hypothetical protein M501DRAFT_1001997 [Patellaria atrata CBS 101060]|uniref:Uncharacterized protein n=1 Tax=Patellaria atrata CBS 101060 TaxID=1346257 RepID=A0A9P4SDT8_9PEZI|nr:hypothetical protein M501DRAFT_1001997 [Patellaria atrata CBS 101060]
MKPSILQFSACIINVGIALAAPNPDTQLEARAPKCKDSLVTSVFSVHSAEATPFCSSYLHIPIKTSKVTTVSQRL